MLPVACLDLSLVWCLWLLTVVSSLDLVYAAWYAASDPTVSRLNSLLTVFTLGMAAILLASDLLSLFLGWETIGLSSCLLISYYGSSRSEAFSAGLKALTYNVLGDIGLLLTVMACLSWTGSTLNCMLSLDSLTAVGLGVLLAGWSKSALYGMHGWLLDAMEGPTPVSALLHSATLVTAGAIVVSKLSSLWTPSNSLCLLLLSLAGLSVLQASLSALWLVDLKRMIASSTCLHLAVSMLGLSLSQQALVHPYLVQHGLVKSLLFFLAGIMIHASLSQDVRRTASDSGLVCLWTLGILLVTGMIGSGLGAYKDLLLTEGILCLGLVSLCVLGLAQLYSLSSLLSLRLRPGLSTVGHSLSLISLLLSLILLNLLVSFAETFSMLEVVDVGLLPYLAMLVLGLSLSQTSLPAKGKPLGLFAYFSRLQLEGLLSFVSLRTLSVLNSSLSFGYYLAFLSLQRD